jgi:hypothetical protein
MGAEGNNDHRRLYHSYAYITEGSVPGWEGMLSREENNSMIVSSLAQESLLN